MNTYPEPSFRHLLSLSDDAGLFEHAKAAAPRPEHGYCVDDVARGLVVLAREPDPSPVLLQLTERYLAFVVDAQATDGSFHNRLGYDRRWRDRPDTGDWWGRALWGLGTVAARCPVPRMRQEALARFEVGLRRRSPWPRAMAFAALGAAEVLAVQPDHSRARRLLADTAPMIGPAGVDTRWLWPERRLGYANAVLAEALIVAGEHLGRHAATAKGLRLLSWLLAVETHGGHLSTTPVGGWGPGQPRPGFDQKPIEAAALADACARAFAVTGETGWADGLHLAVGWFVGDNDGGVEMLDRGTGAGYDGLTRSGRNDNRGAESTLALLSTLQHARALADASAV